MSFMKCRSIGMRGISCRIDLFYLENDLRMFSSLKIEINQFDHLSLAADERRPTLRNLHRDGGRFWPTFKSRYLRDYWELEADFFVDSDLVL